MIFRKRNDFESQDWGSYIRAPFAYALAFLRFLTFSWSTSRSSRAFLLSLPALIAGGILIGGPVLATYLLAESRQILAYQSRIKYYLDVESPEAAEICAKKLVAIKPSQMDSFYQLGYALSLQDKNEEAVDAMNYAARFENDSSIKAHVWSADNLLKDLKTTEDDPEKVALAKKHLEFVADNGDASTIIDSIGANLRLAIILANEEDYEGAETLLYRALNNEFISSNVDPAVEGQAGFLQLQAIKVLMEVFQKNGETEKLKALVNNKSSDLLKIAMQNPALITAWVVLVEMHASIEDYTTAEEIVNTGTSIAPTDEIKQRITQLSWLIAVKRSAKMTENLADLAEQIEPLERQVYDKISEEVYKIRFVILSNALVANFRELAIYNELLNYIKTDPKMVNQDQLIRQTLIRENVNEKDSSTNDILNDFKRELYQLPRNMFVLNIIVGFREYYHGDKELTVQRWRQAASQVPRSDMIINNFIQAIARSSSASYEEALELCELAIAEFDKNLLFLVTRGEIHVLQKNFELARQDFETVLKTAPESAVVRKSLLNVYNELGLDELADEQQKAIDLLEFERLQSESPAVKAN